MQRRAFHPVILALLIAPAGAPAADQSTVRPTATAETTPVLAEPDKKFMQELGRMAIGEVTTSELALQRAASPEVRGLAQAILDFHEEVDPQLAELAQAMDLALPSELDPGRTDFVAELRQLEGAEFDKMYLEGQQMDHRSSLEVYQRQLDSGQNERIRAFATNHLPLQRRMAEEVEQVAQSTGGKAP